MRSRLLILGVLCALRTNGRVAEVPAGFEFQPLLGPLATGTVAFDFLPDGRVLFVHKDSGEVSLWLPGAGSAMTIHTLSDVSNSLERGLLGLAVDPQWPTRPYLYFYQNHSSGNGWLVMCEASGDLADPGSAALMLLDPYPLLTDVPDGGANHKGGGLRFGPDGALYLGIGDDDQKCPAQDTTSLLGKILRIDISQMPGIDPGPPSKSEITPADNPFAGPDENQKLVYAFGLRNPFRFDVDPVGGALLIGDVGSLEFEEIDLLSPTGGERNFGWPIREGFEAHPDHTGLGCGMGSVFVDPAYSYERGAQAAAVIGGIVYHDPGAGFGSEYEGHYFLYDFRRQFLRRLMPSGGGWVVAPPVVGQPSPQDWARDLGAASCIRRGPDGAIYLLNFRSDAGKPGTGLYRIVRTTVVHAPAQVDSWSVVVLPNPGRGGREFSFEYRLSANARVGLRVFDAAGRLVRSMMRPQEAGDASVVWDGRNDRGWQVGSGNYFYRLDDGRGRTATGKLTVLR